MTPTRDDSSRLASEAWVRALKLTAPIEHDRFRTLPVVIDELAERFGSAECAVWEAAFRGSGTNLSR